MGSAMIIGGLLFVFLSKVKNMSDEDLNRALSNHARDTKDAAAAGAAS